MSDLVERLKQHVTYGYMPMACRVVMDHAAAEITRLRAELAEARDKALDEAAEVAERHRHDAWTIAALKGQNDLVASGRNHAGREISQAIRALKSPPPL